MNNKRGGLGGIPVVLLVLFFFIVTGIPVLINVLTGGNPLAGLLTTFVIGLIGTMAIAIILGGIPYVITMVAIHQRLRRLNSC